MRIILEVTSGPQAGKKIEIAPGEARRIGRTPQADFATGDTYMSGVHFAVECQEDACHVRDLKSRNGTTLNNQKVDAAQLKDGDQIAAGNSIFVVRLARAPQAAEPESTDFAATIAPNARRSHVSGAHERPAPPIASAPEHAPPPQSQPSPSYSSPTGDYPPPASDPSILSDPPAQASPASVPGPTAERTPVREQPPASQTPPVPPSLPVETANRPAEEAALTPDVEAALQASFASTPDARLLSILRGQREPLYALLDPMRDSKVLELLRGYPDEHESLYDGRSRQEMADYAPYLIRLAPSSRLLERLAREGWGNDWGVYLTCSLPLAAIRQHYRQALLVKTPDGREFFSRFYAPRFLRDTLEAAKPDEAARFFGPISSYIVEAENPAVLLQFVNTPNGPQKKERLLLLPGG